MNKFIFSLFIILCSLKALAQKDSVAYNKDFIFTDGIYLTTDNFKQNQPIEKINIVSKFKKEDFLFFDNLFSKATFSYKNHKGKEEKLTTADIWGYCSNKTIFINYNNTFNRVAVIGKNCVFSSTVYTYGGFSGAGRTTQTLQFVFNTISNEILELNIDNMEKIIGSDSELLNEFNALNKKQQKDSCFLYLRKFNEKHPFYIFTSSN